MPVHPCTLLSWSENSQMVTSKCPLRTLWSGTMKCHDASNPSGHAIVPAKRHPGFSHLW